MSSVFETERLVLRAPSLEHSKEIASFYLANRDHLKPWSPTMAPAMFTESYWHEESQRRQADVEAGREIRGLLWTKGDQGRIVGTLGLSAIQRGALQGCFLGYALAADAQSHGYMLEAVRGAVAHAFGPLRLHRVMANYMPRNRRSGAVLRRAGFVVEGYARDYLLIDGHWEDHLLTSITNPDWNR